MLVLTRKENESLVIGEDIKLTILAVKGSQVRIGIEAPNHIAIHREELLVNINDAGSALVDNANVSST